MTAWRIRLATSDDAKTLAALAKQTFRETFTHYPEAEVAAYLDIEYTPKVFAAYFDDPEIRIWIAEEGGRAVGYAKLGAYKLPLPPAAEPVLELHRLYVEKSCHGQGIGAALMQEAMTAAADSGARAIYLGVWERNKKAQAFYAHYGFTKAGEYNYPPIGSTIDREWIMMKLI